MLRVRYWSRRIFALVTVAGLVCASFLGGIAESDLPMAARITAGFLAGSLLLLLLYVGVSWSFAQDEIRWAHRNSTHSNEEHAG